MTSGFAKRRIARFARRYTVVAPRLILALCRRFRLDVEEASEILDELLLQLFERIKDSKDEQSFERMPEAQLRLYLATAVGNRYIDRLRHHEIVERNKEELLHALQSPVTPEAAVSRQELTERLRRAIEALRSPYRELFRAILEQDTTLAELARLRGVKRGTIYTQFKRGLEALREAWMEAG